MVKRPNHRKNKNKKKRTRIPSRERHYLSFKEKSVLQIIALSIVIGFIAIALIVILLIFAFFVTVCNFWVQWTWHELRTLFFSQDQGQEEVEA